VLDQEDAERVFTHNERFRRWVGEFPAMGSASHGALNMGNFSKPLEDLVSATFPLLQIPNLREEHNCNSSRSCIIWTVKKGFAAMGSSQSGRPSVNILTSNGSVCNEHA
jgi:hypothetical protein